MKKLLLSCVLCCGLGAGSSAWSDGLILTTEDAPPFNYVDADGVTITGSATDLIREAFKRAGVAYTIEVFPWARAIQMASLTKNTCVYSTHRTPERDKNFKWVGPLGHDDWVLLAKADSTIKLANLEDARKYSIGGYRGDAVNLYLQSQNFLVDEAVDDKQAARKLEARRTDLWATGRLTGPYVAKKLKIKTKTLLSFKSSALYLACNLGTPTPLVTLLNTTLKAMTQDGTTTAINQKYQ